MALKAEQIEQVKLFDFIRSKPLIAPFAFHVANERKTSMYEGRLLKRLGVISGVPDVFIMLPNHRYHALIIELKAGKGKLSPAQQTFLDNMNSQGYCAVCCHGFEAAKAVIETYMGGGGSNSLPQIT